MSKPVWESKRNGDSWFSLDDSGTLWLNRALPPAKPQSRETGTRMYRTDGVGIPLNSDDMEALAAAASRLAPRQPWALDDRKVCAARKEARKAWLRNQARSLGTDE